MKKKYKYIAVLLVLMVSLSGCGFFADYQEYLRDYDEFQEYKAYKELMEPIDQAPANNVPTDTIPTETSPAAPQPVESEPQSYDPEQPVSQMGAGRSVSDNDMNLISSLVTERNEVYTWDNTYEKTMKINELDRKILEAAYYDFSSIQADFIGDSITEGVGGNLDADGNKISYVNYVNQILQLGGIYNNGVAGRTIADHNNPDMSIDRLQDSVFNINSQIILLYAGINDFLCEDELKIYGKLDSGSESGYCGQLQSLVTDVMRNLPDRDYFFVTSYKIKTTDNSVYKDFTGTITLNDYMEPLRILAGRNSNIHIIELYNTGFMSMEDERNITNFFSDSIHPNDAGYKILGEHIAAEILLFYLGM